MKRVYFCFDSETESIQILETVSEGKYFKASYENKYPAVSLLYSEK